MMRSVPRWSSTMCWNTPLGTPARSIAIWKRSPVRIVCEAALSITTLPAISAGTMVLTAVR